MAGMAAGFLGVASMTTAVAVGGGPSDSSFNRSDASRYALPLGNLGNAGALAVQMLALGSDLARKMLGMMKTASYFR